MKNTSETTSYLMRYEPAKHEGMANWRNHEFTYYVETSANIEGEFFYAADLEADNKLKRFNTNRINEIITISC